MIGKYYSQDYTEHISQSKGQEMAIFNLGSSVVLIFESPPIRFKVPRGSSVKVGQLIGTFENLKK